MQNIEGLSYILDENLDLNYDESVSTANWADIYSTSVNNQKYCESCWAVWFHKYKRQAVLSRSYSLHDHC